MPGFYLSGKLWQDEPRKGPLSRCAPRQKIKFPSSSISSLEKEGERRILYSYSQTQKLWRSLVTFLTDSVLKELFWETSCLHIEEWKWFDKSRAMKENFLTTLNVTWIWLSYILILLLSFILQTRNLIQIHCFLQSPSHTSYFPTLFN